MLYNYLHTFRIVRMTEYFWVSMKDSNITRMAMLTSSSITYSRKWSLACASANRIMLSIWRTVIGMLPVAYIYKNLYILYITKNLRQETYHRFSSEIAIHASDFVLIDLM